MPAVLNNMRQLLLAGAICLSCGLWAQNIDFTKSNFPNRKEELKEALRKLETGTGFFQQGKKEVDDFRKSYLSWHKIYPVSLHDYQGAGLEQFRLAIAPLEDANRFNPNNALVNYMLGLSWFHRAPGSEQALRYLEKATDLDPASELDQTFWLGWAYHLEGRWDDALKCYRQYESVLKGKSKSN